MIPEPDDEEFWGSWRVKAGLNAEIINLNPGSCSPTPRPVMEARLRYLATMAADPVPFIWRRMPMLVNAARQDLATHINARPENLLLCANASIAINTLLQTFPWRDGDELVVSDQEYPHYLALFRYLQERRGVKIVTVPLPIDDEAGTSGAVTRDTLERFRAALSPMSRVLFVSHVSCLTGTLLPVPELCALARERGLVSMVDGAHALGQVPLNLRAVGADFYAANVHKWMMGAVGSAFLAVDPSARPLVAPLVIMSGAYFDSARANIAVVPGGPTHWQLSHEYHGTEDQTALAVISEALALRARLGGDEAVFRRMRHLAQTARRGLDRLGLKMATPRDPQAATGMVSAHCPLPPGRAPFDPTEAVASLREKYGIEFVFLPFGPDRWLLRVACGWFMRPSDFEAMQVALEAIDWTSVGVSCQPCG